MPQSLLLRSLFFGLVGVIVLGELPFASCAAASPDDGLNVLFIGNSYTGRHDLSEVVASMAAAGEPSVKLNVSTVIYGGRRLVDHWRLGTQNFVNLYRLTESEVTATIQSLEETLKRDPSDNYAKGALSRQTALQKELKTPHPKWDVIVMQSYRDDLEGDGSLYMEYAPKFASLAKAQGARVILYETTPNTQHAEALTRMPDRDDVMTKTRSIAKLANRIDAAVAPMSSVALRCQTERPELPLRFINDAHLNHTMAYLTACTIYAALFDRTPQGLPVDSITDIRFFGDNDRQKDRDGNPITRKFSSQDRDDLQRIAWEGYQAFEQLRRQEELR